MNYPAFAANGRALQSALTEQPALTLEFFSYGVILKKREGETITEYPVDPAQIATALAAKVTFETGLMSGDTLYIRSEGLKKTVIGYRKGTRTGLYLEGSDEPLRVALPPLLLIRTTHADQQPNYGLYAVKRKTQSLDVELFQAPLPNVYSSGSICWGSVRTISEAALQSCSLIEDWQILFGSPFGDHSVAGKSRAFPHDVRQQLIALEKEQKRVCPKSDLVSAGRTLAQVLA